MAWIWVAMPPAAARSTSSRRRVGGVIQTPRRSSGGERPVGLRLDVREQGGGPRPERPVGEALQPADPGPTDRIGAEDVAAPQTPLERGVEPLGAGARRGRGSAGDPLGQRA